MRTILAVLLLLLSGCDGCRQQTDPFAWLTWHGYRAEWVERMVQPTIGTYPCDQYQEAWHAVATRESPEWESSCERVLSILVICCPPTTGPCRGREIRWECKP